MPQLTRGNVTIYYRFDGADDRPVIVLSHSLGLDHAMWDEQAADLLPHFRVLRYDTRGHGASRATQGEYSIADLAGDVLSLCDALGVDRFAYCGLSLGGMIGQWLTVTLRHRCKGAQRRVARLTEWRALTAGNGERGGNEEQRGQAHRDASHESHRLPAEVSDRESRNLTPRLG